MEGAGHTVNSPAVCDQSVVRCFSQKASHQALVSSFR